MKKVLGTILLSCFVFTGFFLSADAAVHVKGYYRKDGTYVQPHYRSNPDGNPYNNWSYPGNTNPYTGKTAGGNESTYLKNYYSDTKANTHSAYTNTYIPTYTSSYTPETTEIKSISGGYKIGSSIYCFSSHEKVGDSCKRKERGEGASALGLTSSCDSGYMKLNGRCVNYDTYCRSANGDDFFYDVQSGSCAYCTSGYYDRVTSTCKSK